MNKKGEVRCFGRKDKIRKVGKLTSQEDSKPGLVTVCLFFSAYFLHVFRSVFFFVSENIKILSIFATVLFGFLCVLINLVTQIPIYLRKPAFFTNLKTSY